MLLKLNQSIGFEMKAYMAALQSQMNPHFLYNMLSAIAESADEDDSPRTVRMCEKLSSMLRYMADYTSEQVSLEEDIANMRDYLDLMKVRYEEHFSYEIETCEDLRDLRVPRMTLQPLVENCFQHGFKNKRPPWRIGVRFVCENGAWSIEVRDNGCGVSAGEIEGIYQKIDGYQRDLAATYSELRLGRHGAGQHHTAPAPRPPGADTVRHPLLAGGRHHRCDWRKPMIRVMIVEDEPHAQRRLQRMIERLDDFFRIEATAMDGEEALEALKTTRCDVIFTDIRMPIMDGTELMQRVRRQYPEIMLVVLSGYSDFSYVSEAVRSQAVDYLLKPLTEEALVKLLAQLKERYLAREHEQIRRKLAERINKATPPREGEKAADEQLGAFLLCAGALPICESTDMCPGAEFWSGGALREAAAETINELSTFTWEFMGNTPSERIVILRADLGELPQIAALLHSAVTARADMPVSCVCHREPIALAGIDRTLKALRKELEQRAGASARACFWKRPTRRGGRAATRRPFRMRPRP